MWHVSVVCQSPVQVDCYTVQRVFEEELSERQCGAEQGGMCFKGAASAIGCFHTATAHEGFSTAGNCKAAPPACVMLVSPPCCTVSSFQAAPLLCVHPWLLLAVDYASSSCCRLLYVDYGACWQFPAASLLNICDRSMLGCTPSQQC